MRIYRPTSKNVIRLRTRTKPIPKGGGALVKVLASRGPTSIANLAKVKPIRFNF